jgi:hypothetical protein
MKNLINEDIQTMKYLFGYKPGKVLSEQGTPSISTSTPSPTPTVAATGTQTAAATTPEEVIKQIQTILKDKYKQNLGTAGPNKDGVDGKWGNLTQTAFEAASKNIKTPPAAGTPGGEPIRSNPFNAADMKPATGTTAPATSTTAAPATGTTAPATSTTVKTDVGSGPSKADDIIDDGQPQLNAGSQQALSGQLTPQQIRQQARFDQRLARQARRNTRRAGQQGQQ